MENILLGKEKINLPTNGADADKTFAGLLTALSKDYKNADTSKLKKAYDIAKKYHEGQKRRSGEDYIIHPLSVAIILYNLNMDIDTIASGLLHDTIEDTKYTFKLCNNDFGEDIATIVEGVTKLTNINLNNDKVESQAENLRHMFLAMSKDVRVIIVKLADRLHNLMTLEYQTKEKQEEKSLETLEIYSPIANRLGISTIKSSMDDLALRYLKPKEYAELVKNVKLIREARDSFMNILKNDIDNLLKDAGINGEVSGRVKNLFSIYKKMKNKNKTLNEIYDIFAIRVIVDDVKDCYAVLGTVHEKYKPIPGRFKDYIAMPKPNNYRSLHTTVLNHDGTPFEIQIRTKEMHEVAEYGVAAHWAYKENGNSKINKDIDELNKMSWLKDILDENMKESGREFLSYVKNDLDLFTEKVYCFSPQGDVITLPKDSTPIDFAYHIHSAVGNKMVGAKVNEVLVPIDYKLKNGDRVSIITSQNSQGPSRDWMNIVKSAQARSKIQHWFKQERRDENIAIGKDIIDKYCKSHKIKLDDILKEQYLKVLYKKYTSENLDDIYALVGHGGVKESQVVARLLDEYKKDHKEDITDEEIQDKLNNQILKKSTTGNNDIIIKGVTGLDVHFSRCCHPIPGDEIVGFITRGRGITIHRTDCKNVMNIPSIEKSRLIEAEWNDTKKSDFRANIKIYVINRKGLIVDISSTFSENNVDMERIETIKGKDDKYVINVTFQASDREEVNNMVNKIRQIKNVIDVERD